MPILAIETSCDETSAAVVRDGTILSNIVASQTALHAEYGGVVPELAAREHLRNIRPVCRAALHEAGIKAGEIAAVAATRGPGLPNALSVGLKCAQALAFHLGKPFYALNHHEAHLYSPWISGSPLRADFGQFLPSVSLIVSGGHTLLVLVQAELRHRVLGETLDDAAGECFDKTAKFLGLPYPGGPELERLAREGNPKAFDFPRPMLHDNSDDFSFAGLKTSVRYFVQKNPALLEKRQAVCDLCASVQAAIVEVLVHKTVRAARRHRVGCVTASGGVTRNQTLRHSLAQSCAENRLHLRLAETSLCTDNAGMIGVLAARKIRARLPADSLDTEIDPGLSLDPTAIR
jgi:N6-L-threonylcarbamoyladenine synthase